MVPIFIILLITAYVFYNLLNLEVKYVESMIDHKKYLVQDKHNSNEAANLLAKLRNNMNKIIEECNSKKDTKYADFEKYIDRLSDRNNNGIVFSESDPNSPYTSYSVNKGEELVFCLRSKETKKFHDINLIMYVMVHEIAHIACPEYGHTPLFNKLFKFLLQVSINIKLYKKIEFDNKPEEYCGMTITSSII
jgi:hypothetical protein